MSVNIDDQSCQTVSFGMHQPVTVGMHIVGQSKIFSHRQGLFQPFKKKPFVNLAVFEAQQLHGNVVRLTETCSQYVVFVIGHSDGIACLQAFGCGCNGSRKHPRMETAHSFRFAALQLNDRV